MADALWLVRAVQAEERVVPVAIEIERTGAERIFRPAVQAAGIVTIDRHRRHHAARRGPVRPFFLARNDRTATEIRRARARHADAVAHGVAVFLDQIEMTFGDLHHDGARLLLAVPTHLLPHQAGIEGRGVDGADHVAT